MTGQDLAPTPGGPLATMRIDVWSDIACPWCYIGKRNLEAGLAQTVSDEDPPRVEVTFHSYELSPDHPADYDGTPTDYVLETRRGVQRTQLDQIGARVRDAAQAAGLECDFESMQAANTHRAHELLHFAKEHGRQAELKERLMAAYFAEGRHIGRVDELVALATDVGLDADRARDALESGRYAAAVQGDKDQAATYGITGIPFFVINGKYGLSGAQPASAFTQVARQAWAEQRHGTGGAAPSASD